LKKLVILIGLVMLVGIAAGAYAAGVDDTWSIMFRGCNTQGLQALENTIYGTEPGAFDPPAEEEMNADPYDVSASSPDNASVAVTCWDSGFAQGDGYGVDLRAPISGEVKTWNITMSTKSAYGKKAIQLRLWEGQDYNPVLPSGWAGPMPYISVKLSSVPTGVTSVQNLQVGDYLVADWDSSKNGNSATPAYSFTWTSATNINSKAFEFQLEAFMPTVPEPGSIVAMLSGLVGLVGYGIRRRK